MAKAKISKVDGQKAIVLPENLSKRLSFMLGETVYVRETPNGLEITRMTPGEATDLREGEKTLMQYRHNWRYSGG